MGGSAVFPLKFGTAKGLILERECIIDHGWPWCKVYLLPTFQSNLISGGQR
jgi:hypothetical protein